MPYRHTYEILVVCGESGCNRRAEETEVLNPHDGGMGKARDRLREEGWQISFDTLRTRQRIRCPDH